MSREWIARKLLWLAWWIDKDTKFVHQAGYFTFERGWQQPVSQNDQEPADD